MEMLILAGGIAGDDKLNCAKGGTFDQLFNILHNVYLLLLIGVPVIIVIFGIIQLATAVTSADEKAIKTAQKGLISKLMVLVIVFIVAVLVNVVVNFASSGDDTNTITTCIKRVTNG